jgi:hypothetical protein
MSDTDPQRIAAVAKGLGPVRRTFVATVAAPSLPYEMAMELAQLGVVKITTIFANGWGGYNVRYTPLGLAVRAHLEKSNG